ncbi:MAG: GAF domain-containing protein, partial [Desulfosudaceae bacterium]
MTRQKTASGPKEDSSLSAAPENLFSASTEDIPVVLVADGQRARRLPVEEMLRQAGCVVRSAASDRGVRRQLRSPPDLILLAGRLPRTDARDVLRQIRAAAADVPVIVLLPEKDRARRPGLLNEGAAECLMLPAGPGTILPLVERFLETRPEPRFMAGETPASSRSRQAIRRREAYFHQLIQNCMDIIVVTDAEGIVRYHSPSVERILGFSPGERIGQTTFELLHPDDHDRALARFRECLARPGEKIQDDDIRLRDKDGRWHHFEVTGRNLLDDPVVAGIILNVKDVTSYRQLGRTLQERGRALAERVKELDCLYRISRVMQRPGMSLAEVMRETVRIIPDCWQEPQHTRCRIVLFDKTYESPDFTTSPWRQASDIMVDGECWGMVEVFYTRSLGDAPSPSDALAPSGFSDSTLSRAAGGSPFLVEEEKLLTAVAERLGRAAERIIAQEERRHDLLRVESMLALNKLAEAPVSRIADFTLEAIVRDTDSGFGFIGFMSADETVMTIHAWSRAAMEQCRVREPLLHFPVAEAGIWGEAVRHRRPCFVDDYHRDHPAKRGIPEGHAAVYNFMGVPVFGGDRIVAVAGLANRQSGFREIDAKHATVLLEDMWQLLQRKEAED